MTSARSLPLRETNNINIGFFDGKRINPRNITERSISMFIYNNLFC